VTFAVRRLTASDAEAFLDIRLEGLRAEPMMFGSTLEEDAAIGGEQWQARLARNFTFGVFDGERLGGTATYTVEHGAKTMHRGHLVGVYVSPIYRGTGAARQLVAEVIASARQSVKLLYLQVTEANSRAVRFYERMGFEVYGTDPGGLMVDGTMHQDKLMMLRLDEGSRKEDQ
jgi:ribosomal protein S18 acetylase RimI-like enzyme